MQLFIDYYFWSSFFFFFLFIAIGFWAHYEDKDFINIYETILYSFFIAVIPVVNIIFSIFIFYNLAEDLLYLLKKKKRLFRAPITECIDDFEKTSDFFISRLPYYVIEPFFLNGNRHLWMKKKDDIVHFLKTNYHKPEVYNVLITYKETFQQLNNFQQKMPEQASYDFIEEIDFTSMYIFDLFITEISYVIIVSEI